MGLADPHCHTTASDGMVSPADLVAAASLAGLDLIAVCDHDTMRAAAETVERGEEVGLAVVPGQEITTRWPAQTHVLGWFLERPVPMNRTLADTVAAIHDQGALAVIPHPFMPTYFASCQPGMLRSLLEEHAVDGIELLFPAPINAGRLARLLETYQREGARLGAALGGSDSHFGGHDLGRALTRFEGRTAADFRRAVESATTQPVMGVRLSVPLALAARQQVRSLIEMPLKRVRGDL